MIDLLGDILDSFAKIAVAVFGLVLLCIAGVIVHSFIYPPDPNL